MFFYILYLSCLLFSTVLALTNRQELKSRQLGFFPFFLCLVLIQEICIFIYLIKYAEPSTATVYNLYRPIATSFFASFFYRVPGNKAARRLILWMLIVYLAITVIVFLIIQPIYIYNSYLSLASGLVITFYGILFLFNYFKIDSFSEQQIWLPAVWITIGIVAFYPVVNISFALYKHLLAYRATFFGFKLYRVIPQLMSIFMYSCFAYAFYLCKKKN